jgi:hypothetical protein
MTVHDIIRTALAGEFEDVEADSDDVRHLINVLNTLLIDCFEAEQNSRERDGKTLLTEIPQVTALTDEVPYNMMMVGRVLPLGIEWKYAEQNLDQYRADQYERRYEDAKMIAGGGVWL